MKKRIQFTGIILCLCISCIQAQTPDSLPQVADKPRNGIMFGFLGNSPLFSLSFHRHLLPITNRQKQYIGFVDAAIGIGFEPDVAIFGGTTKWYPTLPHSLTLNFGKYKHYLEIGYGGMLENKRLLSNNNYLVSPIVGWRYIASKGFMFRFHFAPWIHTTSEGNGNTTRVRPMAGIFVGKNF